MNASLVYLLVILVPIAVTIPLSLRARRAMMSDELLGSSPRAVEAFILTRAVYWVSFGMISVAFALALIAMRQSGEATRTLIATGSPVLQGPYQVVISQWGVVLLPVVIVSILASIAALFFVGRAALKLMPEDEEPGINFRTARARFFFFGFSLMLPPLLFSTLLAI